MHLPLTTFISGIKLTREYSFKPQKNLYSPSPSPVAVRKPNYGKSSENQKEGEIKILISPENYENRGDVDHEKRDHSHNNDTHVPRKRENADPGTDIPPLLNPYYSRDVSYRLTLGDEEDKSTERISDSWRENKLSGEHVSSQRYMANNNDRDEVEGHACRKRYEKEFSNEDLEMKRLGYPANKRRKLMNIESGKPGDSVSFNSQRDVESERYLQKKIMSKTTENVVHSQHRESVETGYKVQCKPQIEKHKELSLENRMEKGQSLKGQLEQELSSERRTNDPAVIKVLPQTGAISDSESMNTKVSKDNHTKMPDLQSIMAAISREQDIVEQDLERKVEQTEMIRMKTSSMKRNLGRRDEDSTIHIKRSYERGYCTDGKIWKGNRDECVKADKTNAYCRRENRLKSSDDQRKDDLKRKRNQRKEMRRDEDEDQFNRYKPQSKCGVRDEDSDQYHGVDTIGHNSQPKSCSESDRIIVEKISDCEKNMDAVSGRNVSDQYDEVDSISYNSQPKSCSGSDRIVSKKFSDCERNFRKLEQNESKRQTRSHGPNKGHNNGRDVKYSSRTIKEKEVVSACDTIPRRTTTKYRKEVKKRLMFTGALQHCRSKTGLKRKAKEQGGKTTYCQSRANAKYRRPTEYSDHNDPYVFLDDSPLKKQETKPTASAARVADSCRLETKDGRLKSNGISKRSSNRDGLAANDGKKPTPAYDKLYQPKTTASNCDFSPSGDDKYSNGSHCQSSQSGTSDRHRIIKTSSGPLKCDDDKYSNGSHSQDSQTVTSDRQRLMRTSYEPLKNSNKCDDENLFMRKDTKTFSQRRKEKLHVSEDCILQDLHCAPSVPSDIRRKSDTKKRIVDVDPIINNVSNDGQLRKSDARHSTAPSISRNRMGSQRLHNAGSENSSNYEARHKVSNMLLQAKCRYMYQMSISILYVYLFKRDSYFRRISTETSANS